MAGDVIKAEVRGLAELRAVLLGLPDKLRRQALRNALAAGGRVFRDEAARRAPVLNVASASGAAAVRAGVRKPGTVRDAIKVRTSKTARAAGDVGVFVNVVPAKGAKFKVERKGVLFGLATVRTRRQTRASQRGAKSPNDPYYWRFLEFGTHKLRAYGFLQAAARAGYAAALKAIEAKLGPGIQKFDAKSAKS